MADMHLMFDQAYGNEYEAYHTSKENFLNRQIRDVKTFSVIDKHDLGGAEKSTFNVQLNKNEQLQTVLIPQQEWRFLDISFCKSKDEHKEKNHT
jgi:hypothetical protein